MKFMPIYSLALFLVSCASNESQPASEATELITDTSALGGDAIVNLFPLDSFPKMWYMITDPENEPHLFQWCYASIQSIELSKDEQDVLWFTYDYGQEQVFWQVDIFEAEIHETDQVDSITGDILLKDKHDEMALGSWVNFCWQPGKNRCRFSGDEIGTNFYVNEEKRDAYPYKEEECEDSWVE